MSKIGVIKETLENVLNSIDSKNINVTCIFFNNEYNIATTLDIESSYRVKAKLSITELIQSIRKIRCNGYTDFDQISIALDKIPLTNDKVISIIATDGYHTSYLHNTEEIAIRFENYFDLSIGIGHTDDDFDKVLVQYISKDFVFASNTSIVQESIYKYIGYIENNQSQLFHFLFPPESELMVLDSFSKEYIDEPVLNENDIKNNKIVYSWVSSPDYKICEVFMKSNKLEVKEAIHLIIVLDISGSMDDFLANGNEIISLKEDITSENTIKLIKTKNKWLKLNILKSDEKLFFIFNNEFNKNFYFCSDTESTQIMCSQQLDINEITNYSSNLVSVCFDLINYKKLNNRDVQIQWLNTTYNCLLNQTEILYREFYNKIISKIKFLYYNDLNLHERKYFELLNVNKDISIIEVPKLELNNKEVEQSLCTVCYKNNRNVFFDCYHLVLCFECVLILSKMDLIKCPICRKDANWISRVRYINKDFSCMTNNCDYKANVCFYDCNHLYYCSKCYLDNNITECLCGLNVNKACHIMFG